MATKPDSPDSCSGQFGPEYFRRRAVLWAFSVGMLWLAQPPFGLWPFAFVALVPIVTLAMEELAMEERRGAVSVVGRVPWGGIWGISTLFFLVSLQGVRHAHPVMYLGWIVLSAYLAVYQVLFFVTVRRLIRGKIPILVAAPLAWVTMEWIRNYLFTGISVLMLGHTMVDVPVMVQMADLLGAYGIGAVLVVVNVVIAQWAIGLSRRLTRRGGATAKAIPSQASGLAPISGKVVLANSVVGSTVLAAAIGYGIAKTRVAESDAANASEEALATFVLLQRNEPVNFTQDQRREFEMFDNYLKQAVHAAASSERPVDAIVWPESMFTGGLPWREFDANEELVVPEQALMSRDEFVNAVTMQQEELLRRVRYIHQMMAEKAAVLENDTFVPPAMIAGCGVIRFGTEPKVHSGVVCIDPNGQMQNWYAKMHLVMFGEYVPIIPWIPGLNQFIPPGLGLTAGDSPQRMRVKNTIVCPNICVETAVERVPIQQVAPLNTAEAGEADRVDVIVSVTNDGWFDDSSVIDHHLRCAQMSAVACRRPLLSSANNGPTVWIDHYGQIVQQVTRGTTGTITATPQRSHLESAYVRWGDRPVLIMAMVCLVLAWWVGRNSSIHDVNANQESGSDESLMFE